VSLSQALQGSCCCFRVLACSTLLHFVFDVPVLPSTFAQFSANRRIGSSSHNFQPCQLLTPVGYYPIASYWMWTECRPRKRHTDEQLLSIPGCRIKRGFIPVPVPYLDMFLHLCPALLQVADGASDSLALQFAPSFQYQCTWKILAPCRSSVSRRNRVHMARASSSKALWAA
jgi:hypothetical protein